MRLKEVCVTFKEKGFGLKKLSASGAHKDYQAEWSGQPKLEIMNLKENLYEVQRHNFFKSVLLQFDSMPYGAHLL